jgi:RNA-binding motif X-linked protein 2
MNTVREIQQLNERELAAGTSDSASWHAQFAGSAWVFIGGLAPALNEGDVLCVASEWGEVEDIRLVRDETTGRSKGFAFLKFEDARSAVLAVDNLNGAALLGHTLRCDHKPGYEPPKKKGEAAVEREAIAAGVVLPARPMEPGHAYAGLEVAGAYTLGEGFRVWGAPPPEPTPVGGGWSGEERRAWEAAAAPAGGGGGGGGVGGGGGGSGGGGGRPEAGRGGEKRCRGSEERRAAGGRADAQGRGEGGRHRDDDSDEERRHRHRRRRHHHEKGEGDRRR